MRTVMLSGIVLAAIVPMQSLCEEKQSTQPTEQHNPAFADIEAIGAKRVIELTTAALSDVKSTDRKMTLLWVRATAYQQSHEFGNAIRDLNDASRIQPKNEDLEIALGFCLLRIDCVEDARKIFDKLAKTNPDAARTRIGLSYCDYHAGKAVSALQHFSRAQELCPEDWVVIMCSAQLSLTGIEPGRNVRVRQLTRIIDDWESKKSWLPFTLADVFKARAEQYIASSNYGKAAVDFRIARSLCPGGRLECASRYQAAFCYLRMGEYGTARLVADETIALFDKKDIDPYVAKLVTQLRWASLALSGAVDQAAKQTIERARTKRIGPSDFHQAIQYAILAGKFNDALSICRGAMDALGVHYDSIDSCYAYLLSTCPNDKARDGKLALELTEDYEQDHAENSRMLMIRSLALAETAQFDEAARVAAKAAELLPATAPLRAEYLRRSESFKKKSPFRMDARQPDFDLIERP